MDYTNDSIRRAPRPGVEPERYSPFPVQPDVEAPLDVPAVSLRSIVAPRVTFPRRPPEMALFPLGADAPFARIDNPDVALVCSLPTQELAFRIVSLAARIEAQVQESGSPEAVLGLGVLALQARMFEHLHILQSTAGDVP